MTLPEIIAEHMALESKDHGIITRRKIAFDGSRCRFEYEVSFGPDISAPQYRHVYDAELRDFDPKRIEFRRSSSGPVLVLWTRFMRNVVRFEARYPDKGCVKSDLGDQLYIPLKGALSTEQKRELKRLAEGFMSGGSALGHSAEELKRNLDVFDREIQALTNDLDFACQGGVGVLEQQIELSSDRTSLVFRQFRKGTVESEGARLSAKIPLWTIKEEVATRRESEEAGKRLPRVTILARDARKPFKVEFSGLRAFTHKNTLEEIYCQTGGDCDRLKKVMENAIKTAKDLGHLKHSEQGADGNPH